MVKIASKDDYNAGISSVSLATERSANALNQSVSNQI